MIFPEIDLTFMLIGLIVIIIFIIVVLRVIERKMYTKIVDRKTSRDNFYAEEVKKIDFSNQQNTIKNIEKLSKEFFKEAFEIKNTEFSEMQRIFREKNNKLAEEFCAIMGYLLFSGKEVDPRYTQRAAYILTEIIETTHIKTKEEKEEALKSQKK